MGKPKRGPGATTATARAQSATAERAAQDWWNNVQDPPAPEAPPANQQEPAEWPPEEEGDWFFIEFIRELPFIIGITTRWLMRINKLYWAHIWLAVFGWRAGFSALEAFDKHLQLTSFTAMLSKLAMCGVVHFLTTVLENRASLPTAFLRGFLVRILYIAFGGMYTFVFLGVTHTPFSSWFGQDSVHEGDAVERAFTPLFIITLIVIKHVHVLGWCLPGIWEPARTNRDCVWFPVFLPNC